jgi:hypothetical protein
MRKSFSRFLGLGLLGLMLATVAVPTFASSPQKKGGGKKGGKKGGSKSSKKGGVGK